LGANFYRAAQVPFGNILGFFHHLLQRGGDPSHEHDENDQRYHCLHDKHEQSLILQGLHRSPRYLQGLGRQESGLAGRIRSAVLGC
jgi:hypothetical protein